MALSARERLDELAATLEDGLVVNLSDLQRWREEVLGLLRTLLPPEHDRLQQLANYPTHSSYRRNVGYTPRGMPTEEQELANKLGWFTAVLRGIVTELDVQERPAASLVTTGLHPWVAEAIADLWNDDHHRQAVSEAALAVETNLKAKLGRQDLSGVALVTAAFNPDPPKPGEPRLRFTKIEANTDSWTDAHQGAMEYARGCMFRIRNVSVHSDAKLPKQEALESLAALSLLARWIEDAEVVN